MMPVSMVEHVWLFTLNLCVCEGCAKACLGLQLCLVWLPLAEDNSNAPERKASVQGTPEQVQGVQKMIQDIIEQVMRSISQSF